MHTCSLPLCILEQAKAIEKRALRVGVYDGINMEDLTESWTIIQELRRMIFINEGISQVESEFNDQLDKNSRHFLLFRKSLSCLLHPLYKAFFMNYVSYYCIRKAFT
jgi:hypothetical protein